MKLQFFPLIFIFFLLESYAQELPVNTIIYGLDNRIESDYHSDPNFKKLARSVVALVRKERLSYRSGDKADFYEYSTFSAKEHLKLCEYEKFSMQPFLAECAGVLIAPDLILTAGHCFESEDDCDFYDFIFDFKKGTKKFPLKNHYSCKEIVARSTANHLTTFHDYLIVKLDREVIDRKPVKLRKRGKISLGSPVFAISYPMGIPQKIIDNAVVTKERVLLPNGVDSKAVNSRIRKERPYFNANLDAYIYSSGSPVFNKKNGLLEGILIAGENDEFRYVEEDDCFVSKRLPESRDASYERVLKTTEIKELFDLLPQSPLFSLPFFSEF